MVWCWSFFGKLKFQLKPFSNIVLMWVGRTVNCVWSTCGISLLYHLTYYRSQTSVSRPNLRIRSYVNHLPVLERRDVKNENFMSTTMCRVSQQPLEYETTGSLSGTLFLSSHAPTTPSTTLVMYSYSLVLTLTVTLILYSIPSLSSVVLPTIV